jgi:hypothetical protein
LRTISKVIRAICAGLFCAATGCWLVADFGTTPDSIADAATDVGPPQDVTMPAQDTGRAPDATADARDASTLDGAMDAQTLFLVPNGDFEDGGLPDPGKSCGNLWQTTVLNKFTQLTLVDGGLGLACEVCPAPNKPSHEYPLVNDVRMKLSSPMDAKYIIRLKLKNSSPLKFALDKGVTVGVKSTSDAGVEVLISNDAGPILPPGTAKWEVGSSREFLAKTGQLLTITIQSDRLSAVGDDGGAKPNCFLVDDVELVPVP